MGGKLGIVAGAGELPRRLAAAARESGREVFVIGLHGQVDPETLACAPSDEFRIGSVGAMIEALESRAIKDIVFVGKVRRPSLREVRPDWAAAKFLARIGFKVMGDDSFLSAVSHALEERGFRVLAPHEVLVDMLSPAGVLSRRKPDDDAWSDINRGIEVVQALGRVDVGQAVVVQQGLVLGVEAVEGTDALIARCAALKLSGPGGVLVKMKKPQQQGRHDMPVVGLGTLRAASDAGLRGVAVEAGGTLMIDRKEMIEFADKNGLFLIGIEKPA